MRHKIVLLQGVPKQARKSSEDAQALGTLALGTLALKKFGPGKFSKSSTSVTGPKKALKCLQTFSQYFSDIYASKDAVYIIVIRTSKREVRLSVFLGYKSLCRALVRQCKKGRVGARDAHTSIKIGSKIINMKSKLNQCLFILVINYLWKLYVLCLLI